VHVAIVKFEQLILHTVLEDVTPGTIQAITRITHCTTKNDVRNAGETRTVPGLCYALTRDGRLVPTASHLRIRDGLAVVLALVRVWYVAELDREGIHTLTFYGRCWWLPAYNLLWRCSRIVIVCLDTVPQVLPKGVNTACAKCCQ